MGPVAIFVAHLCAMKNSVQPLIMLILVLGILGSCRKEPVTQNGSSSEGGLMTKDADCWSGVEVTCFGILAFQDTQRFQEVYDCLNNAYETWNDDFEATYGNLSEDDYEAMAISLGFDEDQPLIDFENHFGTSSYRRQLEAAIAVWEANGGAPADHPGNDDLIGDPILAAMMNT